MLMEVQTRSLSTPLDHTRPFSFSAGKCPSSGLPSSEIHEASASDDSPVNADSECDGFKVPFTFDGDGDGDSSNGVEKSIQMVNDPGEVGVHEDSARRFSAVKLQKSYRGYRTRRRLADSAVVAEELWWFAIDYARLNRSTISFFNFLKPETAVSRWNRISLNASKVGKGLSINGKAQKLAFQHWIEAIDPRHRYGHSLHLYYEEWCKAVAGQPFFYWLDIGDGKDVDLKECPRSKLKQQTIKYLGPQEREHYEYVVVDGKIIHKQSGTFLDTKKGTKWIFVMSTFKRLYAGEKKKGAFHHSSFLAGGATLAAGRLEVEDGVLKAISAYSGHYKPTDDHLDSFLKFLEENGVVLMDVEVHRASEDSDVYDDIKSVGGGTKADIPSKLEPLDIKKIGEEVGEDEPSSKAAEVSRAGSKTEYKRTLSGGLKSPRTDVPKKAILQRINSKKTVNSYQLGHQLSLRWTTGAGPRIGCVADYPVELRVHALELVNLSPRTPPTPSSSSKRMAGFPSPTMDTFNGDDSSSSNSKS